MKTTTEEPMPADNMELLKQQAEGCGAACSCHTGGASGKVKMLICGAVLLVAAALVVKAVTKSSATAATAPVAGFAVPAGDSATAPAAAESAPATGVAPATDASVGTMIASFAELNTLAGNTNAVFVYLPGKEANTGKAPATVMQAAARTIEAQGGKCALFTLRAGSPDYDNLGPQAPTPGVLAMVRGKGMSAVSGEITETKLVQGYVAASSAGGCGPSGCGPSGCP
jgi:hypothetical protein